ncbi:class I SAM-dependent methyltransferase [Paenibacillus sp. NPDC057967]|uniref:class I SAM-dependent methyltransferase n=1 Tax=Paenibacillus sp. NPDC057967 TaxID=3346293 RepID=UPI0036D946B7
MVQREIKVVIGAGAFNHNPDWLQTEESELNLLMPSQWESRFELQSISAILAEHVWEHLSYEEGLKAAKLCIQYLKPGGYIRCAVPDANFRNEWYQSMVKVGGPGPADHPAASHKIVYDYMSLTSMFTEAGFQARLLEYCDEDGRFIYQDWDERDGYIYRSKRFDHRNQDDSLGFVSLIVDAIKPI